MKHEDFVRTHPGPHTEFSLFLLVTKFQSEIVNSKEAPEIIKNLGSRKFTIREKSTLILLL